MAVLTVVTEPAVSPKGSRKKSSRLISGMRRKHVRQLDKILRSVFNDDVREAARAEKLGYDPFLFAGDSNNANRRAIRTLLGRCQVAMEAREGDMV